MHEYIYTTKHRAPLHGKMSKQIITSIRVDEGLWKEAKKFAIDEDLSLAQLIENLLKEELEKRKRR